MSKFAIVARNDDQTRNNWYFVVRLERDCKVTTTDSWSRSIETKKYKKGSYFIECQANFQNAPISYVSIDNELANELIQMCNESVIDYHKRVEEYLYT